jgi:hypothetical protein
LELEFGDLVDIFKGVHAMVIEAFVLEADDCEVMLGDNVT